MRSRTVRRGPGQRGACRSSGWTSPGAAVDQTRLRGASALVRDVNDRLPGEGRWGTVLLADGNIGIGGDPLALLQRCRELLRPGAVALVETSADPQEDRRTTVTLHGPSGRRSHAVPWAVVGAQALVELAARAGFVAVEDWRCRAGRSSCSGTPAEPLPREAVDNAGPVGRRLARMAG